MARGIISTILGGVAGGLEGRRDQFLREREEAERKAERDRLMETQNFGARMQLIQAGATPGARLTEDFDAQAARRQTRLDSTLSRALQDHAVAPPADPRSLSERGVESALGRAFQTAEIAPRREQFIPQVQDPRYAQIQGLGGENDQWSIMTPEAMREDEQAMRAAEIADDRAYQSLVRQEDYDFRNNLATDDRAFQERMFGLEKELKLRLPGMEKADAIELINFRRGLEKQDMQDPVVLLYNARQNLAQMMMRVNSFGEGASQEAVDSAADAYAKMIGVTREELLDHTYRHLNSPYAIPERFIGRGSSQPQSRGESPYAIPDSVVGIRDMPDSVMFGGRAPDSTSRSLYGNLNSDSTRRR